MEKKLATGQLLAILFLGITALTVEVLPGRIGGGGLAWVAPLLALLVGLPLARLASHTREKHGQGLGLSAFLSKPWGRCCAAVFLLGGIFLLGVNAARTANRLASESGAEVLILIVVLAVVAWMAWGKLAAFGRSCELFLLAFGIALGVIALLTLFRVRPDYVLLSTHAELVGLPGAVLAVLGVVGAGAYALFLDVESDQKEAPHLGPWTLVLLLSQALILFLVLGRLGTGLAASVERPFFQMVAGIGLAGAFQRLEALISAIWLLGDLALLGLLLFACRNLLAILSAKKERGWFALVPAILALALAGGLLSSPGALDLLLSFGVPLVGGVLGTGILILWFLATKTAHSKKIEKK